MTSKTGTTTIAKMILEDEYPEYPGNLSSMDTWKWCNSNIANKIYNGKYVKDYKVYCFVRNPFSRVYASFRHFIRNRHGKRIVQHLDFNDFVKYRLKEMMGDKHFMPMRNYINRVPVPMEILRFENLNEELKRIFGREPCHENRKSDKADYHEVYSDESVKIVGELYKWDIDTFGYQY